MSLDFSYRHLYYFWVVGKEGGMSRAAERLGMAVQTVSTQVRELERSLGVELLKPAGRKLVLTEAGVAALQQADLIFQLGEQLPALVRDAVSVPVLRLSIGTSDGLSKLMVHRLLQPVMGVPGMRLHCHEGEFDDLLADLALHRLDLVLADRPAPANPNIKVYSHALAVSALAWYGTPALVAKASVDFPHSLAGVPVLLPSAHSAVRARLELWFEREGVKPCVVGEFEDSALLNTFAAGGMGVFPAPERVHEELTRSVGVERIATCHGVEECFFAIGNEKKVQHPLLQRILQKES
ncbi:LysR family transcriptional regulator [Rhodobacteraceae bacterium CH30]|nr:LysR family transcriptional regulator [Rhodobacteraceae bacterium CH30]